MFVGFFWLVGSAPTHPQPTMTGIDTSCLLPVPQSLFLIVHCCTLHPFAPMNILDGHIQTSLTLNYLHACFVSFGMFFFVQMLFCVLACLFGVFSCTFRGFPPSYISYLTLNTYTHAAVALLIWHNVIKWCMFWYFSINENQSLFEFWV